MAVVVAILLGMFMMAGCGGFVISSDGCLLVALRLDPDTAVADHNAPAPGNTVVFATFQTTSPITCADRPIVVFTSSDPQTVSVTSGTGETSATATCLRASPDPVTVTATMTAANGKRLASSATLVCH